MYKMTKKELCPPLTGCVCEFICDSEDDIANLPECESSSMAIVASEGMPVYMKNASGEWVKL